MLKYQAEVLKTLFSAVVRQNVTPEVWSWLNEKVAPANNSQSFNIAFVSVPRRTGKAVIALTNEQVAAIGEAGAGSTITGWTIDRLCRVWLLANANHTEEEKYARTVETLFLTAEVNELVALYSALPVLWYPERWTKRCAEGIRSNIGAALEAIMCNNPYPAAYLDESAWNQLILKAFFTEKPVEQIIGIDARANEDLAKTLSDYAHERWAAHRPVNPQIWRCTGKFINADIFPDMERLFTSEHDFDREAAALACSDSHYPPAQELLNKNQYIKSAITSGQLSWNVLAEKMKNYVLQS
ncbi:EboA domain-containing protein [Agriterribacter sp.]|uniref:EboA domain-containing protein n=1 Tax=Agriterribacter sp. TaxID=2821509 RepID=UPI002CB0E387|nr:EboA domain-containing protein [Agriterribacter sp.]HTN06797.1 EboA domain-containing protein [Agriterribacter sp.]